MEPLVMFLLLTISQVSGGTALAFGSMADCTQARVEAIKAPDLIVISECVRVELTSPKTPKTL